jgi:hypothetical protein
LVFGLITWGQVREEVRDASDASKNGTKSR